QLVVVVEQAQRDARTRRGPPLDHARIHGLVARALVDEGRDAGVRAEGVVLACILEERPVQLARALVAVVEYRKRVGAPPFVERRGPEVQSEALGEIERRRENDE